MNNNDVTTAKLHVGNLPFNVREREVGELFGKYGRLRYVKVMVDYKSGKSLGYGFVEYEERKDAEKAQQELNNMEWNGRKLRLNWNVDRRKQMGEYHTREFRMNQNNEGRYNRGERNYPIGNKTAEGRFFKSISEVE